MSAPETAGPLGSWFGQQCCRPSRRWWWRANAVWRSVPPQFATSKPADAAVFRHGLHEAIELWTEEYVRWGLVAASRFSDNIVLKPHHDLECYEIRTR